MVVSKTWLAREKAAEAKIAEAKIAEARSNPGAVSSSPAEPPDETPPDETPPESWRAAEKRLEAMLLEQATENRALRDELRALAARGAPSGGGAPTPAPLSLSRPPLPLRRAPFPPLAGGGTTAAVRLVRGHHPSQWSSPEASRQFRGAYAAAAPSVAASPSSFEPRGRAAPPGSVADALAAAARMMAGNDLDLDRERERDAGRRLALTLDRERRRDPIVARGSASAPGSASAARRLDPAAAAAALGASAAKRARGGAGAGGDGAKAPPPRDEGATPRRALWSEGGDGAS